MVPATLLITTGGLIAEDISWKTCGSAYGPLDLPVGSYRGTGEGCPEGRADAWADVAAQLQNTVLQQVVPNWACNWMACTVQPQPGCDRQAGTYSDPTPNAFVVIDTCDDATQTWIVEIKMLVADNNFATFECDPCSP